MENFRALVVDQNENEFTVDISNLSLGDLPEIGRAHV